PLPLRRGGLKARAHFSRHAHSRNCPQMKIRFADNRPAGDFALVLPVAGKNRSALDSLGDSRTQVEAALNPQRCEGESASAAELFVPAETGVRRLLIVGTGEGAASEEDAEKLGGTIV